MHAYVSVMLWFNVSWTTCTCGPWHPCVCAKATQSWTWSRFSSKPLILVRANFPGTVHLRCAFELNLLHVLDCVAFTHTHECHGPHVQVFHDTLNHNITDPYACMAAKSIMCYNGFNNQMLEALGMSYFLQLTCDLLLIPQSSIYNNFLEA